MKVKRGLLYTASHEWVDFMPDGTARVGISDFVPQKRGKISFLNLCDEGEYYQSGEVIGDAPATLTEALTSGRDAGVAPRAVVDAGPPVPPVGPAIDAGLPPPIDAVPPPQDGP